MSVCVGCSTDIKPNTSFINCDVCQGQLHLKCVGLSETDVKLTRSKSRAVKVVCNNCNANISQFKDIKSLISTMQDELTSSINKLKIEFESQLNDLRSALAAKEQIPSLDFEDVVNEVVERQKRKSNLIIFGVKESSENLSRDEVANYELSQAQNILTSVLQGYTNDNMKPQRLGRRILNRARPLKICLRSESEVISVLKNSRKLRDFDELKNVFVSSDKTPRQMELFRKLKDELNVRIANGERNLKIRYVNGTPKIVKQDNLN